MEPFSLLAIGIGTTLLSASLSYAMQPNIKQPNVAQSSRDAVLADAATLPGKRAVEQAARMGTKVSYPTGRMTTTPPTYTTRTYWDPLSRGMRTERVQTNPGGTVPEMVTADFTGRGDIQNQQYLAGEMAKLNLDLSKKYSPQYIKQALEMEKLADPEGWKARELLAQTITSQAGQTPQRPVATTIQQQIADEMALGKRMDSGARGQVDATLASRAGVGDTITQDLAGALESGAPGQARELARNQKTLSWLSSGATPEDVTYRRRQQDIANQAAFLRGETPQAQFAQLSGAQKGAAPVMTGPSLSGLNPSQQSAGTNAAATGYSQQVRSINSNVNDWFAGISTAIKGAQVAGAAGYKPFA